jgi:hypothetical protein
MIPDSVVEAALDAARRHRIPDTDSLVVFKELYPSSYAIAMSDMRRALEAAAPMLAPQWIKCSERMPENDERVLAMFASIMRTVFHDETGWHPDICTTYTADATHWMPLPTDPQPPKESGV